MAKIIEIKKEGEKLIWLAENKAEYNTGVTVSEGCQAIVLCDGAIVDNLYPGSHTINIKRMFSKADGKIWSVYGVNSSEHFELPWGCQTKHKDPEYDIVVTLKMSGEVVAKIDNGSKLFRLIGPKEGVITKSMVEDQFRRKLIDEVQNCVGKVTKEVMDDSIITDIKSQVANKLSESLKSVLRDRYGLSISDALVRINSCEELDKIWELKRLAVASKFQKEISESTGAGMKAIAEGINAMAPQPPEKEQKKGKTIELIINEEERR